jgi:VWFA-related protein
LIVLFLVITACGGGDGAEVTALPTTALPPDDTPIPFTPPAGITATITRIDTTNCPDISLFISVSDEKGEPVLDLTDQNFSVLEDGNEKNITATYENNITEPIVFSLIIDNSLSLEDSDVVNAENAASYFVSELFDFTASNLLDNWGEVIKFARDLETLQTFTNVEQEILDGIAAPFSERGQKGTRLYDAIGKGIEDIIAFRSAPPAGNNLPERSVLIVVTDGQDTVSSNYDKDSIIAAAAAENIQIIAIGFGSDIDGQALFDLAQGTGGLFFSVPTSDDLTSIFSQFLENLKNQYVLRYTSGAGAHSVEVEVDNGSLTDSDSQTFSCP